MRARIVSIGITLMSLISLVRPSLGFTIIPYRRPTLVSILERISTTTAVSNSAEPLTSKDFAIEGKNGKTIAVGSIVRVTVSNLKAYQVPAAARGTFNEDKEFVPAPEGASRAFQNLLVPVGMRGVVTKITNKATSLSANFPIQVKFSPGENVDEGYDAPVSFVMHFGVNEVEAV